MRHCFILATLGILAGKATLAWAVGGAAYVSTQDGLERFVLAEDGRPTPWLVSGDDWPGVMRVAGMLQRDVKLVVGAEPALATSVDELDGNVAVIVGTLDKSPLINDLVSRGKLDARGLVGRWETFVLEVVEQPLPGIDRALVIVGSDKRGTIFGMFDLSAQVGVSPWHWWADVPTPQQPNLYVLPGRHSRGEPKVKFRGIFINDEAPALSGWMQDKFGGPNHKFYAHVFELILRLQGNYLWPAMWGRAIYDDDPESPKLADELGVVIGTTHHEPMMRAHVEWERYGEGPWNYERNQDRLRQFWREGVERMGTNESVVTVGMRGDGDEPMSESANIALLEQIIVDQRTIIGEVTGRRPEETPQMWALYKEVQEYYDRGMRVPDDIMLLLCDDNWGNIRKLPKLGDPPRRGGYGVYYHFDYVGGPRNYKWLNTNPLPRVWEQMHLAYEYGADRLWIVNVGDIKPMELPISFFLDYAWNPDAWPAEQLPEYHRKWAAAQFGDEHAAAIADILAKYAKYNGRRKPELLLPDTFSLTNFREAERIVADWNALADEARRLGALLPPEFRDAYFQLVLFPVEACANLNELYVTAASNRLYSRQGRASTNVLARRVTELFERDAALCRKYNEELAGGKWRHMMDQTHIGYTNWQEPRRNRAPRTRTIDLPVGPLLGVSVEGAEATWPNDGNIDKPQLVFDRYDPQPSRFIELFNRSQQPLEYELHWDASWVAVSEPSNQVDEDLRIEVHVDWTQAPAGTAEATLTVAGPGDQRVAVQIVAKQPDDDEDFHGFVESDGVIAIEAEHYARAVETQSIRWQRIPDLGRTLSGVTPFPVTSPRKTPVGAGPRMEYDFHLFEGGDVTVSAFVSPTLDFTAGDGRRYAVSIDDAEPQIVNINADDSMRAWEHGVADNIVVSPTNHKVNGAGAHVLKFWMVDPGVVLQRLVVHRGELPASYLGPPESLYR
jgi:hypothetical protein